VWPQFGEAGNYVKFTAESTLEQAKDLRGDACTVLREVMEARLKQGK
jgi:hypothetical protein